MGAHVEVTEKIILFEDLLFAINGDGLLKGSLILYKSHKWSYYVLSSKNKL